MCASAPMPDLPGLPEPARDRVRVEPAAFLVAAPAPLPAGSAERLADRVRGLLLGLAIGDALGATSEGLAPAERRAAFGEITGYLPHPHADGRAVGLPTDDTQMAFWALERMLEDGRVDPGGILATFARRRIHGIGATVRAALAAHEAGAEWSEAGQASAGNGALMRIAPVLLPHVRAPTPAMWTDTLLLGMITHNDPGSNAACLAFVDLLWRLLGWPWPEGAAGGAAPEPAWWVERFTATMAAVEGKTAYRPRRPGPDWEGPISAFARERCLAALEQDLSVLDACEAWYSGAYLLETVPSVLYILARHGDDPETAIVRAVNDTRDNDTVAAIVGAAVGALHGADALPARWREGLPGRTGATDDGRVFELVEAAVDRWVAPPPVL